jgi:hypothetical protein
VCYVENGASSVISYLRVIHDGLVWLLIHIDMVYANTQFIETSFIVSKQFRVN